MGHPPLVGVVAATYVFLSLLTLVGVVRRHERGSRPVLSAILFPLAWTAWYYADRRQPESDQIT